MCREGEAAVPTARPGAGVPQLRGGQLPEADAADH